ncbi:MAG: 5-(carboxyamino)imidazole ribonucleotide synthase [Anaerolineae bacterium]|nr:5-(carboxyamino)imidazole ribonucleotide synthase [Phycisphaerae bacterium]
MILPGQTIGILGGGQLGRMFAIAARRMGYRVHALDPTPDGPAGQVADYEINAPYDDLDAARRFAFGVDVVTFEFENVPAETLAAIEEIRPVHPSPFVLETCRHRLREKKFLVEHGIPVTEFREVRSAEDSPLAASQIGSRSILKSADYGYDGKGQIRIDDPSQAADAFNKIGRPLSILEKVVPFDFEISVICARTSSGQTQCFAPGRNDHVNGVLNVTTAPAQVSPRVERDAVELAIAICSALNLVGVLAVEMFVVGEEILVNELAPRPHNSGHHTFDACVTSQFEQQLRAVCDLPLGDPTLLRPAAMANLLGDLWQDRTPNWPAALRDPRAKLHLYGKQIPKPGRKMGHITAMADSSNEAREIVLAARKALLE